MTGAIALYKALHPAATAQQIRAALLASAAPTASLQHPTTRTGGRLDVWAMLQRAPGAGCACPAGEYCSQSSQWEDTCTRW